MGQITINGKQLAFEGKRIVLDIAKEHGLEIPHYCYHPGLSIAASCRICLAEVAQPNPRKDNKVELIPKLLPTCQTLAVDGMEVNTQSPKAVANQKAVMEYLLINHPLDCPVCDQAGECYLQDYSYKYGRAESRFEEAKVKQPKKDIGPHVYLYSDRCIMCSRCVRFTREVSQTSELGVMGRGDKEQIDIFPGKPLDNELSGNVVDICPVGALLDKEFLFEQRVWFLTQTASIDGITASGDNISIEHNEGRIFRIKPRANPAVNQWWISDEIRYGWTFVHSENRLVEPKRVQYGTPISTDWQRAYQDVAEAFKKMVRDQGAGQLAVMISPMLASEEAYLLGQWIKALDPQAVLAVGPVPMEGEDRTYGGGYTVRSQKCPNSRGVRRALELVCDQGQKVLAYDAFVKKLVDKRCVTTGVLLTGNYPSPWVTKDLAAALKRKWVVMIDTLPNDLTEKVNVLLPSVTWAEKAGVFENVDGRLQSFEQAIPVIEHGKSEGQIALDLIAACLLGESEIYRADRIRQRMGGVFVTEVYHPQPQDQSQPEMAYVAL